MPLKGLYVPVEIVLEAAPDPDTVHLDVLEMNL